MKVAKWGNSLAVRLPQAAVDALALKEGDEVELRPSGERSFTIVRQASAEERLARLRELLKGTMPDDFRFDRDEANER